jgi:sugar/nucleoside kinase (ribokinase family)
LRDGLENGNQSSMKKLGFLGAMNRDLVATLSGADLIRQIGAEAEPLVETAVSDTAALRGAEALTRLGTRSFLGGSAFNVARVVGILNTVSPLVDGQFVGIAGAVDGGWPHVEALVELGISPRRITKFETPPATCLAMVEPGGRTLLTALGANAQVQNYLTAERDGIVSALSECDVVHVTSFLDPVAPALLAEIIADAKLLNSALKLSLDPGAAWVFPGGDGFARLLSQTDILHLNHEELEYLMRLQAGGIGTVGQRLAQHGWMIVSRHHEWVGVYEGRGAVVSAQSELPKASDPIAVVDANGAGDTFCGAFLWAWLSGRAAIEAARFGFACARAKVGVSGPLTRNDLPQEAFALELRPAD